MATMIEINYNRRGNEVSVYLNDTFLDLPYLDGKIIKEWFKQVEVGNRVWKGLLVELRERLESDADIQLEFVSDVKSKTIFYECLIEQGVDIEEDEEIIFVSLNFYRIAHNNYETALYYLDPEQDQEELAREYFLKAAVHGHARAMYELGKCYCYGIGGDFNEEESIVWFKKAISLGCIEAAEELNIIHVEDEDTKKYNRELLMLTEQFNSENGINTAMLDLEE